MKLPRLHLLAFALVLALVLSPLLWPVAAFAQDVAATKVALPWGDWLTTLIGGIGAIVVAFALRMLSYAPPFVSSLLTEQLLKRAVDYALGVVAGAAKGKVLEIDVANDVIRTAAQYAVDHGAPWLLAYIGDLGPKIVARLSDAGALPADASAANLVQVPLVVKK